MVSIYILRCSPLYRLFPYTTLFRSIVLVDDLDLATSWDPHAAWLEALRARVHEGLPTVATATISASARDRKSTRLNSSHVANSYAVFCMKKKKNRPIKDKF